MEKYLTVKQLAEMLNVSVSCIWRWVARGKLPKGERISKRCTRWRESEIVKALEPLKNPVPSEES